MMTSFLSIEQVILARITYQFVEKLLSFMLVFYCSVVVCSTMKELGKPSTH